MANFYSGSSSKKQRQKNIDIEIYQKEQLEQYRAFMTAYVKRINESTFNVAIGGVRIGLAKYSRLAQINLNNRVITFSRYAIENVPERGRRYLVLHELAHVKEASHNKRFWQLVAKYEPDYWQIGKSLEKAFKQNVKRKDWSQPSILSLDNGQFDTLSSKEANKNAVLALGTDADYGDDLLSALAEEQEKYQSLESIYDNDLEHFLDWLC